MNHRRLYLLAALSLSAIIPIVFAVWRRPYRLLVFLTAFSLTASAQNWSTFLDPSRAVDWSGAGFSIPSYSVNCSTQPTLTANDITAAPANTTAIQNALASCDATHNVVNIAAGTYYVASWTYGSQGYQVVRGAGPNSTTLITTDRVGCTGLWLGPCMMPATPQGWSSPTQMPPSGAQQCTWSSGFSKGTTVITLSSCGGAPTGSMLMTLYHANDSSDTGGIYTCDSYTTGCTVESAGNPSGPQYSGNITHSAQQIVWIASSAVVNNGDGTYSVTISPGVLMDNVRHHTEYAGTLNEWPHVRWQTPVVNEGLENLTLQHGAAELYVATKTGFVAGRYVKGVTSGATAYIIGQNQYDVALNAAAVQGGQFTAGETIQETLTRGGSSDGTTTTVSTQASLDTGVGMMNCYHCWVKNVRSTYGGRNHVFIDGSYAPVVRDSYFYESQAHGSQSYGIEIETMTSGLIENNIFQQVTNSVLFGQGMGNVVGYNYANYEGFQNADGSNNAWAETATSGHNAGSTMNLWEGNNVLGIWSDDSWGSNYTSTFFRNQLRGWQNGKTEATFAVSLESWSRAFNVVGNVIGQPSYQTNYESYATSTTGGVNGGDTAVNHSVYALGWNGNSTLGTCTGSPLCDSMVRSTLMRWGNYDVVTAGTKWDATEASPAAVAYVNANFTSTYFGSLAHALPASLYYNSAPSWWPAGKNWPAIGPDVSSGNVGICTGTYAGAQATSAGQCTGGTLSTAWASHATSIPAQDCYLAMGGTPDGSGSALSFDANACYTSSGSTTGTGPASPIGLNAVVK